MPELITEEDRKEAKEWFASKIDRMKKYDFFLKAQHKTEPEHGKYPTFKSYIYALSEMYRQFADIYEVMNGMMDSIYTLTRDANTKNIKLNKELKRLKRKFGEHEPTLKKLNKAFEMTEKVFDEGR